MMAYEQQQFEKTHLLETTAKVKQVREEVTKKLDEYRKDYDEMHIRALTAELQASNLEMKLEETLRQLDSEKAMVHSLVDELANEKSQNSIRNNSIEFAKQNLSDIRTKLKLEFDKIQKNQKDMRIGINSIMRCVFEYKTGVISQRDFYCAVDLIFSTLESNDNSLISPSPPKHSSSHLEVIFSFDSLTELASLPPKQRREKLQGLIDHLSPDYLFSSTDDIINFAFNDSMAKVATAPPIPTRTNKSANRPINRDPPPLPPRPNMFTSSNSIPKFFTGNNHPSVTDSDSDYEYDDVISNIRSNSLVFTKMNKVAPPKTPPLSVEKRSNNVHMKKSKSFDVLQTQDKTDYRLSMDSNSDSYSFPFEHVMLWRKMIGVRDSSFLTGSLPRLFHGADDNEESLCYYIDPNEFRSIVSRVRGESVKMGTAACQRVINRVDSIVKTRRTSFRARSNLGSTSEYLSLLGEEPKNQSWLAEINKKRESFKKGKKKQKPVPPAKPKLKPRQNYENQSLKASSNSNIKSVEISKEERTQVNSFSIPRTSSGRTFDDPQYDVNVCAKDIYNLTASPYSTPDHSPPHKATPPMLPPRPHLVDIQLIERHPSPPPPPYQERPPKPAPRPTPRKRNNAIKKDTKSLKPKQDSFKKLCGSDLLNSTSPAYFTLKHTHQLVASGENEGNEEDPSYYSLGRFECVADSDRLTPDYTDEIEEILQLSNPAAEESSSSESDDFEYEIPPDAIQGYVEPTVLESSDEYSRDRKFATSVPTTENVLCEKQGYLHKLDPKLKHWTKRWFILKGKELKYFSKKGNQCRAKGVINLGTWCKITRNELASSFQLATPTRTYHLVAASSTDCEDWIKALQLVMRMCQMNSTSSSSKAIIAGWVKIKLKSWTQGVQKNWATLVDDNLHLHQDPEKPPFMSFSLVDASVHHNWEVPDFKINTLTSYKNEFIIIIELGIKDDIENPELICLMLDSNKDKDNWFFHLVSVSSGESGPELTITEKLIARLYRSELEGNLIAMTTMWSNPILNYTTELIQHPILTLPSVIMSSEAVEMFKVVHLFIATPFDPLGLDYHIMSFQQLINKSLVQIPLQDELYCQVFRQISAPPGVDNHILLQGWFLFCLLIPHIGPQRKLVQWYMTALIKRQKTIQTHQATVMQLISLCEQRLKRVEKNGLREKKPSSYELYSLISQPIHITCLMQMKIKIPVHLLNDTTISIDCDVCTTVQEFISAINQEIGMQDTHSTGFALMSDWPGEEGFDVFYLFPNTKLFDVISIWSDSLAELGNISTMYTRVIRLTYRRRLSLKARRGKESDKEAILLAYQISKDVLSDFYPVSLIDQALDIAARMAQIEYGDLAAVPNAAVIAKDIVRRFCPIKFTKNTLPHDMDRFGDKLIQKWENYHGVSAPKCAKMLLSMFTDLWSLYGASLFSCKDLYSILTSQKNSSLWIAIHEDGVHFLNINNMRVIASYSYKEIVTFGGQDGDFMLVINSRQLVSSSAVQTEKIILGMSKFQIREATYLMASYLDS